MKNMIMQKLNLFALGALLCGLGPVTLQQAIAAGSEAKDQPFTVGAEAGTLGLGASASWRFADHFGVRGGLNYFSYSRDGDNIEGIAYNSKLRLLSEPVGVDFFPSPHSSFRVTAGILLNQNQLTGQMPQLAPGQTIVLGNLGNTYDQTIGALNLEVKQQTVSPYVAIGGSVHLDKAQRWSLAGELGVAYTGSPKVTLGHSAPIINATLSQDEAAEAAQIEDKLNKFKLYPILKFSVNFSF